MLKGKSWMTTRFTSNQKTFIVFSAAGVIGLITEISCVAFFFRFFELSALTSKALAFPIAVFVTWIINRNLTFNEYKKSNFVTEFIKYLNVTLIGAMVNNSVYILIVNLFDTTLVTALLAVAAGSAAGLTTNFFGARRYVFNKKTNGDDL